jgi:hypothetical protein
MKRREEQVGLKRLVWPPYLVEPPYIEGYFGEDQGILGLSPSIILDLYPKKLFPWA